MIRNIAQDLRSRIQHSLDIVREVSSQTDPQEMVRKYRKRASRLYPQDASVSLGRRNLTNPWFRVTRDTRWNEDINPWMQPDQLPLYKGGFLAELIYSNDVHIITDLQIPPDDPAAAHLEGMKSLIAFPLFDKGESRNMVLIMKREPDAFDLELIPDQIISANLFGRATHNLVLAEELQKAYDLLDAEFAAISDIQRSLLPAEAPSCTGLDIASYYATAQRAGGDYYDFFKIDDDRTGILIADVSGHGAAAAVVMARMHASLHAFEGPLEQPGEVLRFANDNLLQHCRVEMAMVTFVTAFYAVYNMSDRTLHYSSAGHNLPRLHRADGSIESITGANQLPLGIQCGLQYGSATRQMNQRDSVVLYTDGFVEAANAAGEMFETDRLDAAIRQPHNHPSDIVRNIVSALDNFVGDTPYLDDRTLVTITAK